MTQLLLRPVTRIASGLAALLFLSAATVSTAMAQTTIDAVSPSGKISTTNTPVSVPVTITRTDNTPVLGFSVDFTVSSELSLPSGTSSITLGGFLAADGAATNFQVIDHGGGQYTADGVTLGTPCGSSALTGTLFSIDVASTDPSGTGTVTITNVILRDCSNATLSSSIGTAASAGIDNTLPSAAVTAPNGGEFWVVGSTQNITWTASDDEAIDAAGIDLDYSNDNGSSWVSIATNLANSGSYAWAVPNDASTTALVRVTARDVNGNSVQDVSDAVFTIGYYVITVTQGANGSIAPAGPVNVVYDGTQAFTITPDAGYHTTDVVVDGNSQGVQTDYTFNNVTADHTITATFAENQLSIDDVTVDEGDGTATFTVSLNAPVPAGQTVTVDYATADGSAVAPDDYVAIGTTTLTFNVGESSKPVSVTINDDAVDEPDEDFTVGLSNPSGASITTATGTGTIQDNDAEPTVSLSVDTATLAEDGSDSPATVTATLSGQSSAAITVDLAFSGAATLNDDYTRSGTQIVIPALGTTGSVTIAAVQDAIDEPDEDVVVDVDAVSAGATENGTQQVTVTILDDDAEPTVSLSVDTATLAEDGSDSPATVTATLSGQSSAAITVDLAFSGAATLNDDYTRSGTQIVIPALGTTGSVTIAAVQDAIDEPDEDVVVDVDAVSAGATENGTQQVTVTILDDDAEPTVSLSVDTATLAEDGSDSPATVTATLSGQSSAAITVDLAFSGAATLNDDYTRSGTQIVIPALGTTGSVTIAAVQDAIDEPDEDVVVDVDAVSAGATENGTQQVTVTILDDDAEPTLSIDDVALAEGDAGTTNFDFTVTLSAASGQVVTVDYATANGGAIAPGDFTAIGTTTLTFNPGETTKPVVVVVNGDTGSEPDETFTVNLSNPVNATLTTATGTGTILNDDALGDLAAAQLKSGNDTDGTTKITLTFTAPSGVAAVEVYRAGFGGYPEYDDNGGAAPPAPGAYPPSGPWTLTGVTASGQTDEPATRDFYYYVLYTQNGGGGWSPPSNVTTGTLNYHLGDVSDGSTPGQGNNAVATEDISLLGSNYGLVLGASDPVGYLDVGPTADLSVDALPSTDNVINFEDLVMFAINYGQVTAPQAAAHPVAAAGGSNALVLHAPGRVATGADIEVGLDASGNGLVQAMSVALTWNPAVVAPAGVSSGALIDAQNGVVLSARPGTVDAALLGRNRTGLVGEGTIAKLRFRVIAEGDPQFGIASVDARDGANHKVTMAASTGPLPRPVPLTTTLSGAVPNPSRGSATVVFGLAQAGPVEISLYSVDGRRVRTLARGFREAGEYRMAWDGCDDTGRALAPGAYFIRMVTPGAQFTRKLTFLK